jgi:cytidylate kinase
VINPINTGLQNKTLPIPVITIDGPSGAGKGTITLRVAKHLGWHTLDSGALYRVLAYASIQHAIPLAAETAIANLATQLDIHFEALPDLSDIRIILDGPDVTAAIRTETCGQAASQIAALPAVRLALLTTQRAFRQAPGLVADGRDMGTVVFPDATLKIFLTASTEERAQRRHKQLKEKGIDVRLTDLINEITERDKRDSTRTTAPLTAAPDAWHLDTTGMTIDKVVTCILNKVSKYTTGTILVEE